MGPFKELMQSRHVFRLLRGQKEETVNMLRRKAAEVPAAPIQHPIREAGLRRLSPTQLGPQLIEIEIFISSAVKTHI